MMNIKSRNITVIQRQNRIVDYIERKSKLNGSVGFNDIVEVFGKGRYKNVRKELVRLQHQKRVEIAPQGGFRTMRID